MQFSRTELLMLTYKYSMMLVDIMFIKTKNYDCINANSLTPDISLNKTLKIVTGKKIYNELLLKKQLIPVSDYAKNQPIPVTGTVINNIQW